MDALCLMWGLDKAEGRGLCVTAWGTIESPYALDMCTIPARMAKTLSLVASTQAAQPDVCLALSDALLSLLQHSPARHHFTAPPDMELSLLNRLLADTSVAAGDV